MDTEEVHSIFRFTLRITLSSLGTRTPREPYSLHSPQFNPDDIGRLDRFSNNNSANTSPSIEHTGKEIFFHNVIVFINRIHDVYRTKGTELVRENL